MPKRVLTTDKQVQGAKAIDGKRTDYTIDMKGVHGLCLYVLPSGGKTFFFRCMVHGRKHQKTIGKYGPVTLAEAIAEARTIYDGILRGQALGKRREAITFRELADRALRENVRIGSARTRREYQRNLEHDVFPEIGEMPADNVRREHVAWIVEKVASRGKATMADRTCAMVRGIYSWGVRAGLAQSNPAVNIAKRARGKAEQRHLEPTEIAALWKALGPESEFDWIRPSDACLRLLLLTGARPSELAGLRWREIEWNKGLITIPAARCKVHAYGNHVIPMAEQVVELLREMRRRNNDSPRTAGNTHVFPPAPDPDVRPLAADTTNTRFKRHCARLNIEGATQYDLRNTCLGWLETSRFEYEARIVAHHSPSDTTARYYATRVDHERIREALQAWANQIDEWLAQPLTELQS